VTDPKDDAVAPEEPPARESHLSLDKIPVPHDHAPVHAMYALLGLGVVTAALGFTGVELGVPGLGPDTARVVAVLAFGLALMAKFVRASRLHDDDAAAFSLRAVDHYIGLLEQAVLVALLATVVLVAAGSALSDKLAHHQFGRWWFTTVRAGTFSIAMMGAVFATQQQRHLAMDLVSKRLSPRGRLVLGLVLKLLTIAIAAFFYRSGLHQRETVGDSGEGLSIFGMNIVDKDIVTMIPIGAALIIVHCLLHIGLDVDYLARGKLPPERARSGH
jgi:TRAP-type C4-dicarboxylate transport system permease small subunit